MLQDEFEKILKSHELWLQDDPRGKKAKLRGASLFRAILGGANLIDAILIRAKLSCANLIDAILIRANLSCADMRGANLIKANLNGAELDGANMSGANFNPDFFYAINEKPYSSRRDAEQARKEEA